MYSQESKRESQESTSFFGSQPRDFFRDDLDANTQRMSGKMSKIWLKKRNLSLNLMIEADNKNQFYPYHFCEY